MKDVELSVEAEQLLFGQHAWPRALKKLPPPAKHTTSNCEGLRGIGSNSVKNFVDEVIENRVEMRLETNDIYERALNSPVDEVAK